LPGWICLILVGCLLLPGCAGAVREEGPASRAPGQLPEARPQDRDLPAMRDLPPSSSTRESSLAVVGRLHVATLQMTPQTSLSHWWSQGRSPDDAALGRWRANGLDAVILPAPPQGGEAAGALGRRGWAMTVSPDWSVLDVAPPLPRRASIVYQPGDDPPKPLHLGPGRPRLLLRAQWEGERIELTIMPHHHQPQPRLHPVTAQEQMLEGVRFDELTLTAELKRGEVLVIAQHASAVAAPAAVAVAVAAPTSPAAQADTEAKAQALPAPEAQTPPPAEAAPQREEDQVVATLAPGQAANLGALLLSALRLRQPTQTVLLMTPAGPASGDSAP
jgi:hypothetical protein